MDPGRIITVTLNTAIDRVVVGGREAARRPGGKGINVSRVLGLAGEPSIAMGFVGEREASQFERIAPGVDARLTTVPGETRVNTTTLDPDARTESHVRTAGFSVTPTHVRALGERLDALVRTGDVVVFSGSVPPGMHGRDLCALVRACAARGADVAVDTSGDAARVVRDTPIWLMKLNAHELAECAGAPMDDAAQVIAGARSCRARLVCITRGAQGAMLITPSEMFTARADVDQGTVVSTVGCGDAFLAGLVRAHIRGQSVDAGLRVAVGLASAQATAASGGIIDPTRAARFTEATRVCRE